MYIHVIHMYIHVLRLTMYVHDLFEILVTITYVKCTSNIVEQKKFIRTVVDIVLKAVSGEITAILNSSHKQSMFFLKLCISLLLLTIL